MAVTSIANKLKSGSLLVGNSYYIPPSYESIATVTVGAGGSSYVEFTSIPQTYSHLQIRGIVLTTDLVDIGVRVGNGSADSGNNYAKHGTYASATAGSAGYADQTYMNAYGYVSGTTPTYPMGFVADILDYKNTNKYKTMRSFAGMDKNSNYGEVGLYSGVWKSTSAIDTIRLICPGVSFVQHTHIALYGVKG